MNYKQLYKILSKTTLQGFQIHDITVLQCVRGEILYFYSNFQVLPRLKD